MSWQLQPRCWSFRAPLCRQGWPVHGLIPLVHEALPCTACAAMAAAGIGTAFCVLLLGRSTKPGINITSYKIRHASSGSCSLDAN